MGTRFFWLPWRSRHAVGTTTRWAQGPLWANELGYLEQGRGSFVNNSSGWYLAQTAASMLSYSVTTDPARVPLTESKLIASASTPDFFPRYDPYFYAYYQTACAYTEPGVPMETVDARGPYTYWQFLRPWAFFSYELLGVSSITGSQFSPGGTGVDNWIPIWLKSRRVSPYSTFNYLGWQARAEWDMGGLSPVCIYVLRPSTGAIVGWLAQFYINGGYGPVAATNNEVPQSVPGTQKKWLDTATIFTYAWIGDVYGIQDHDLIVWEWWLQGRLSCGGMAHSYRGIPPFGLSIESAICGGLPGQPLTRDGQSMPNWAPSHGTPGTITGIEPSPPQQPQVSVGF